MYIHINTWHHHENGVTTQEVPKDIHSSLTQRGMVSKLKKIMPLMRIQNANFMRKKSVNCRSSSIRKKIQSNYTRGLQGFPHRKNGFVVKEVKKGASVNYG